MAGQSQRCDTCGLELLVDWSKSDLDRVPQVLVAACPQCRAEYSRVAPVTEGGDGRFWLLADTRCRICSFTQRCVFPAGSNQTALECGRCGFAASEVIGDDDDDDDEGEPFGSIPS